MDKTGYNLRQRKAIRNIRWTIENECGMLENSVSDHCEGYEEDEALLNDHKALTEYIYELAVTEFNEEGHTVCGKRGQELVEDIKLCGKEWLMEQIDKMLKAEGY